MKKVPDDRLKEAITFQTVSVDDHELLLRIYGNAREDELARTPWSGAQTTHYHTVYPESTHEIVLLDNVPVGRLFVNRGKEEIAILDLTILTENRNKGIGKFVVESLQREGARSGRPVRIYVEFFNPSTAFFNRLGFRAVEQDGVNVKFVWKP